MGIFNILLIEDEDVQRDALLAHLKQENYNVFPTASAEEALTIFTAQDIDAVITDFNLPEKDGQFVLEQVKAQNPLIPVIIITAFASIDKAVQSIKVGAYDYITKPIDVDKLFQTLKNALDHKTIITENERLKKLLHKEFSFDGIIASGGKMQEVLNMAGRVAESKASILLRGESGTGKEVMARTIHFSSLRKDKPFVAFNVAALSPTLIESELFGHEKGSFTGADRLRLGRFEEADAGTIFIDEIGDIPVEVQMKFLRVLQENYIERIGGNKRIDVDIRVIAASSKNLDKMIREGTFREDLYYRLNVVTINLPALRERRDDIPPLCDHFLKHFSKENKKPISGFTKDAMNAIMKYPYPGNIRELENIIERAVILARGNIIDRNDLPPDMIAQRPIQPDNNLEGLEQQVEALEKQMLADELIRCGGNQSKAARNLKITERKLRYKIGKYGI